MPQEPNDPVRRTAVAAAAAHFGFPLSADQLGRLDRYRSILLRDNERLHVAAAADDGDWDGRHLVDALAGLAALPAVPELRVVDVGAGGGLPGLVLRIARPDLHLTVLEMRPKKARFLERAVAELALDRVTVLNARAEDVGQDPATRERWDLAVTRSVAKPATMAELCLPLVAVGGRVVVWTWQDRGAEVAQAERAAGVLGGRLAAGPPLDAPGIMPDRRLVVMVKERPTPPTYPRPFLEPRTRPLGIAV